jgi:hypothetical protein
MYLLARQANLRGLDAPAWAVEIGAAAAAGLGTDVGVWATALSPGFGTITWTSMWADLTALEKGFADISVSAKYLEIAAKGVEFLNGSIDDTLYESVYEGSDAGAANDARYVGTISAVCAPGNFARGMMGGIEIAQRAEKATGVSTGFMSAQTGAYGSVMWVAGYKTMAEFEAAQHSIAADMSFVEYVDSVSTAYQPVPSVTQSTLHMRLN